MAQHNELGQKGEDAASDYLVKNGYKIVKRNWKYERYEIDIIAQKDEYIVFVEVKTRSSAIWGNPEDAVSKGKIKRIVDAADFYIREFDVDRVPRFDVVAMIWDGQRFEIEHFDDAFLAPVN